MLKNEKKSKHKGNLKSKKTCTLCQKLEHRNLLKTQNKDKGFISKRFTDCHYAVEKLKEYQNSNYHC